MKIIVVFLCSVLAFAQDRTVSMEARVQKGGSPNNIQQFMIFVSDTSKELGITTAIRPGISEGYVRIMYLDVTGPIERIADFNDRLKIRPGVTTLKKTKDEPAKDPNENFQESITRKFKVTGTGKKLGALLEAIKKTAGKSDVTFVDAIPNIGGSKRFVTIQVKGQYRNLNDFHTRLLGARGIDDVEALPEEKKGEQ